MVVVAQLVEPRIVIPVVAGSSPVDHPIFLIGSPLWIPDKEEGIPQEIVRHAAPREQDTL